MFIRTKKIKEQNYAYLVRNVWRKRKKASRQKVAKYLGKVYKFKAANNDDFFELFSINDVNDYIEKKGRKGVIKDLIKWELMKLGFKENNKLLVNNELNFCIESFAFLSQNKPIKAVIELNEGFLCKETIAKILNFKQSDEEREGFNLAKAFVEAGLKIPQEIFVEYYKRYFSI